MDPPQEAIWLPDHVMERYELQYRSFIRALLKAGYAIPSDVRQFCDRERVEHLNEQATIVCRSSLIAHRSSLIAHRSSLVAPC